MIPVITTLLILGLLVYGIVSSMRDTNSGIGFSLLLIGVTLTFLAFVSSIFFKG